MAASRLNGEEEKERKGRREERVQLKHKLETMLNPKMKMMRESDGRSIKKKKKQKMQGKRWFR